MWWPKNNCDVVVAFDSRTMANHFAYERFKNISRRHRAAHFEASVLSRINWHISTTTGMIHNIYIFNRDGVRHDFSSFSFQMQNRCACIMRNGTVKIRPQAQQKSKSCFSECCSHSNLLYPRSHLQGHPPAILIQELFINLIALSQDGLHCCRTGNYKLHYFETLSGLRFIINTDPSVCGFRLIWCIQIITGSGHAGFTAAHLCQPLCWVRCP